jgi:hypothetical protein
LIETTGSGEGDGDVLTTLLIPAVLALLPIFRKARGGALLSPPYLLLMGALFVLRHLYRKNQSS